MPLVDPLTGATARMQKATFVITLAVAAGWITGPAAAGCQKGLASAPFIGAADMRAIDRAAVHLPAERPGKLHLSVGAPLPRRVARKPLPAAVARILPQYASGGYTAFRSGTRLVIVDRRDVLSYIFPMGHPTRAGNCP